MSMIWKLSLLSMFVLNPAITSIASVPTTESSGLSKSRSKKLKTSDKHTHRPLATPQTTKQKPKQRSTWKCSHNATSLNASKTLKWRVLQILKADIRFKATTTSLTSFSVNSSKYCLKKVSSAAWTFIGSRSQSARFLSTFMPIWTRRMKLCRLTSPKLRKTGILPIFICRGLWNSKRGSQRRKKLNLPLHSRRRRPSLTPLPSCK